MTNTQRYLRRAATMARPTPVFPDVGSTIVPPAATGVEELALGQQVTVESLPDAVEADQRRVADEVEERVGHLHGRAGVGQRADPQPVRPGRRAGRVEGDGAAVG